MRNRTCPIQLCDIINYGIKAKWVHFKMSSFAKWVQVHFGKNEISHFWRKNDVQPKNGVRQFIFAVSLVSLVILAIIIDYIRRITYSYTSTFMCQKYIEKSMPQVKVCSKFPKPWRV